MFSSAQLRPKRTHELTEVGREKKDRRRENGEKFKTGRGKKRWGTETQSSFHGRCCVLVTQDLWSQH